MLRRVASVWVVWLGLLWVASPALACTRASDRDCCPDGVTAPCSDEGSGVDLRVLATLCCVGAPAASPVVSTEVSRIANVQPRDSGSPDTIVALAWFVTLAPSDRGSSAAPPEIPSARTEAAAIYLHTRRLRL